MSPSLNAALQNAWGKTNITAHDVDGNVGGNTGAVYGLKDGVPVVNGTNIQIDTRGFKFDLSNNRTLAGLGFILGHELGHHDQFMALNSNAGFDTRSLWRQDSIHIDRKNLLMDLQSHGNRTMENDASYHGFQAYREILQ
jgi:hypothetical protein